MQPITDSSEQQARSARRWRLAFAGMVLSVVIFGSNFVISRHGLTHGINAYDMLALRFATAGLVFLPTFLRAGVADCAGVGWFRGCVLLVLSGFPMSYLMLTGLGFAPAAHGASITPGTVTLVGIAAGVAFFAVKLTPQIIGGIAIVIGGLACMAVAGSKGASGSTLIGDGFFLMTGLVWGFYPVAVRLWRIDGLRAAAIVSVLSLGYLPIYFALFFRGFDIAPWWVLVLHAINQGILNVVLGLLIWGWATHVMGPAAVGRFPPAIPVVGTLAAIPVLGELPSGLQVLGIALIVTGLFISSLRRSEAAQPAPQHGQVPERAEDEPRDQRPG